MEDSYHSDRSSRVACSIVKSWKQLSCITVRKTKKRIFLSVYKEYGLGIFLAISPLDGFEEFHICFKNKVLRIKY